MGLFLSKVNKRIRYIATPHPNAARLFLDFAFSKEGQIAMSQAEKVPYLRKDISYDWVHPAFRIPSGQKVIPSSAEELETIPQGIALAEKIWGKLQK